MSHSLVMSLRASELVVVGWCVVAGVVSVARRLPHVNRVRLLVGAGLLASAVVLCSLLPGDGPAGVVRIPAPALFVLAAYRVSAGFFVQPQVGLEAWLASIDRRFVPWLARARPRGAWSRWMMEVLEASYLAVYVVLPLGAWASWAHGGVAALDLYWTLVFLAEGTSYLALAWIQTRPPRALEVDAPRTGHRSLARRVNEVVLLHGSIQVNTLPSGHAAGATAVALALAWLDVPSAPLFGVAAAVICVATVAGRYHYLVDTVAGVLVALVWWVVLRAWLVG